MNTSLAGGISQTDYSGHAAYRLTDGRNEAIVVPALGRVMRYGRVGGPNVLWNSDPNKQYKAGDWKNWGGDKTWPAPQNWWTVLSGQGWPPDLAWEGTPQQAQVMPNGKLRTVSDVSAGFGARIIREYWFDAKGDFVINQTAEKLRGEPVMLSLWSVTQVAPPDAIFLPLNRESTYKENFHWIKTPDNESPVVRITPTLLQVRSTPGSSYKIGVDALASAIIAVKDGLAFMARTPYEKGDYPDGALGHGFPVELWNNGDAQAYYNELELLSPLQVLRTGSRINHTMHWSLHQLPYRDLTAPEVRAQIEQLLQTSVNEEPPTVTSNAPAVTPTPRSATTAKADDTDFRLIVAPNKELTVGTMAIMPIQPLKSTAQAIKVAQFARTLFTATKQWKTLYIYVFNDKQAAQSFKDYQTKHEGRPLRSTDYLHLVDIWSKAPIRYEVRGSEESVSYPSKSPRRWWRQ
ncbi:MAG: hypothetical protein JO316_22200 [Abitibacteriaceae bacterium]|nr:hypothetical protein [Abditibacteriaceae bacterium]MBV9868076.1 hypothetical protein [Abditibacteriaceae bacterium]